MQVRVKVHGLTGLETSHVVADAEIYLKYDYRCVLLYSRMDMSDSKLRVSFIMLSCA